MVNFRSATTRRTGGPKLAIARLLPHDSRQLPGASQFIKPNDVEPVDRLDPPPALGTPMPAIRHGANFYAPRAKPDGNRSGSIVHAGRSTFHADHVCTLPKGCFSSSSRRLESTVRKHSLPGACSLWPSAYHDGVRQRSALHSWANEVIRACLADKPWRFWPYLATQAKSSGDG